jgi:hypothetical protein
MARSKSRQSTLETSSNSTKFEEFKIGDRVKSSHPIFSDLICTISGFPSPDAAIVELESGARERILLKHLEQLQHTEQSGLDVPENHGTQVVKDKLNGEPEPKYSYATSVEVMEELSPDEERERHRLELKVERAFIESAAALRQLRDRRLYRDTHPNDFVGYCRDRFGKTKQAVNYLIAALEVYENLTTTIGCRVLPTNERQCRELAKLPHKKQPIAWDSAVEENDGKVPSSRIIKSVVERLKEKPLFLASDYCKLGEVFFLQCLTQQERKYNGYWAIAIEVENRFTVKAVTYKEILEVKQENIKRIDCEQTQAEIKEIHQRLTRLTKCQLDPIDEAQLEILCRRPWFTQRQKDALTTLERVYEVK